jgi:hypothetical protein
MKHLKIISIIAIPYFTICGGLYHIAYWSTFNINGFEYFGITDLIKSFVYPFFSFFTTFFIVFFIVNLLYNPKKSPPRDSAKENKFRKFIDSNIVTLLLITAWIILLSYFFNHGNKDRWFSWVVFAEFPLTIYLYRKGLFKDIFIDNRFRMNVISSLVFIPIISLASGKYNSELIQAGFKYKYSIHTHFDSNSNRFINDTLKFLGRTEHYLFMTDLNNSNIQIIRAASVDTLILKYNSK